MIKKFSFPRMQNLQFVFEPKMQYVLTAESLLRRDKLREANPTCLQFPTWCAGGDLNSHGFYSTTPSK